MHWTSASCGGLTNALVATAPLVRLADSSTNSPSWIEACAVRFALAAAVLLSAARLLSASAFALGSLQIQARFCDPGCPSWLHTSGGKVISMSGFFRGHVWLPTVVWLQSGFTSPLSWSVPVADAAICSPLGLSTVAKIAKRRIRINAKATGFPTEDDSLGSLPTELSLILLSC